MKKAPSPVRRIVPKVRYRTVKPTLRLCRPSDSTSYRPTHRVRHQFQQVIAELQDLRHVAQRISGPAESAAAQSGPKNPVTVLNKSPIGATSRLKDSGEGVTGMNDDMASAEADKLALSLLEISIKEKRQAKRLRELVGRLDDLSHLRRSVAAALSNM